jgi:hypothetical protein
MPIFAHWCDTDQAVIATGIGFGFERETELALGSKVNFYSLESVFITGEALCLEGG